MSGLEQILKSAQFLLNKLGPEKALSKINEKLNQATEELNTTDEYKLEKAIYTIQEIFECKLLPESFFKSFDRKLTDAKTMVIAYALKLKPNLPPKALSEWIGYGCTRQKIWQCKKYLQSLNSKIPCDQEFILNYEKLLKLIDNNEQNL